LKKIFPIALSILSGLFLATALVPSSYTWFVFCLASFIVDCRKTTKKAAFIGIALLPFLLGMHLPLGGFGTVQMWVAF
jgi:hypothetical protein